MCLIQGFLLLLNNSGLSGLEVNRVGREVCWYVRNLLRLFGRISHPIFVFFYMPSEIQYSKHLRNARTHIMCGLYKNIQKSIYNICVNGLLISSENKSAVIFCVFVAILYFFNSFYCPGKTFN